MVDVSVIVSTYNRAESLRDTIQSLVNQKAEADGCSYEIIVVDNNSKDATRHVLESFNGRVRYFFEPRQGLSYARNRGIGEARGQVIAFTDDDVIVDPNWVSSIYRCFKETKALQVAGKIERLWNSPRPDWLTDEIAGPLIVQDLGPVRKRWNSARCHTVGANMAFHRVVFEKFGRFREELGRRGEALIGGEDREFFMRLFQGGAPIFYEPKAVVYHKIEKERLSKDFLRRWFWDVGKTLGHGMERKWHHIFTAAPLWLWKNWLGACLRFVRGRGVLQYGRLFQRRGVLQYALTGEAERFAGEIWMTHYGAMIWERLVHWLPWNLGQKACVFKMQRESTI